MLRTLFFKECKGILKSITYFIFVACIAVFYITQIGSSSVSGITKPLPGEDYYGYKSLEDHQLLMEKTMETLAREVEYNAFVTYPIGFYKEVKLNEEDLKQVQAIYNELSAGDGVGIKEDLTYSLFNEKMAIIDDLLGGGSSYSANMMEMSAQVEMTYEDALADFNELLVNNQLANAYARLFCDYMGIVLGILPVFLAVTISVKDKKAKADQVIYAKKSNAATVVAARYFAVVAMIMLPLIIICIMPTLQAAYSASSNGYSIDYLAFPKYLAGWLLPIVLFTVGLGFFVTELIGGPMAILLQVIFWFISLFMSLGKLVGTVGTSLIPRFNTIGETQRFQEIFDELVINRIGYSVVGLTLMGLTILIFSLKRRGKLGNARKIRKNSRNKS